MTPRGSSGLRRSRPPFPVILSITVTGIMANTLIGPAIPDIRDDFGVGTSAVSLIVAAAAAPGILMAPLIGVLSDRFGRREVLVPCLLLFALAGGLGAFAGSFSVLLGLRFLQGAGAAGLVNLAVVLIGDHWEGAERTRRIGRNAAALLSSIVVLPSIGGLLADAWGWRATFAPYWLGLVTAVAVLALVPSAGPRQPTTLRAQMGAAAPFLRAPAVVGSVTVAFVAFMLIFGLFLTVMPVYLKDGFAVSSAGRGLLLSLPAVTSTTAALLLGRLAARAGLRRVLGLATVLWVVAFALIASVPSLPVVICAVLIYGFGEGLLIPTLQDTVTGAAPASSRGAVVALFVSFARAGQTTGPLLGGAGMEGSGARATFAAGAVLAGVMALAQIRLLRHLGQESPPPGANPVLASAEP